VAAALSTAVCARHDGSTVDPPTYRRPGTCPLQPLSYALPIPSPAYVTHRPASGDSDIRPLDSNKRIWRPEVVEEKD